MRFAQTLAGTIGLLVALSVAGCGYTPIACVGASCDPDGTEARSGGGGSAAGTEIDTAGGIQVGVVRSAERTEKCDEDGDEEGPSTAPTEREAVDGREGQEEHRSDVDEVGERTDGSGQHRQRGTDGAVVAPQRLAWRRQLSHEGEEPDHGTAGSDPQHQHSPPG